MSWMAFSFLQRHQRPRRATSRRLGCLPRLEPLETRELLSDLPVTTATYLSGPNADNATAVAVAPDKTLVFAGKVDGNDFGLTPTSLLGGGTGAVLRFNSAGTVPLSITRLPGIVRDMQVSTSDGDIAVIGDNYLALLRPDASSLIWSTTTSSSTNKRVSLGADDTVAALVDKTLTTYDNSGNVLGQWTLGNTQVNDVAVDASSGSVFVAADDNKRLDSGLPVRVAVVYSYDYTGAAKWTDYGWAGSDLTGNEADTNAVRLALGRDGQLYLAGYSAGGNSMFRKDPHDLGTDAPNVAYDNYTNPFNTGSNNITYIARLSPSDGSIQAGQFLLTRLDTGRGNTMQPYAIAADEYGQVYVGGSAAAYIADRASQTIAGQPVGPYQGDGFVLVLSADFRTRQVWTTWSGQPDGGGSRVNGIAAGNGIAVMAADITSGTLITVNALQDTPGHAPASATPVAFLSAWPSQVSAVLLGTSRALASPAPSSDPGAETAGALDGAFMRLGTAGGDVLARATYSSVERNDSHVQVLDAVARWLRTDGYGTPPWGTYGPLKPNDASLAGRVPGVVEESSAGSGGLSGEGSGLSRGHGLATDRRAGPGAEALDGAEAGLDALK